MATDCLARSPNYSSLRGVLDKRICLSEARNDAVNAIVAAYADLVGLKENFYKTVRAAARARENHLLGKKGEYLAAYALHCLCDFPLVEPDVALRTGPQTGWQIDLDYGEGFPPVHVKTCDDYTKGYAKDFSWSFQFKNKNNDGGQDPVFKLKKDSPDIFVFMYLANWENPDGVVKSILGWDDISAKLRDPQLDEHKGRIFCLYQEDLQRVAA